MAVLTKAHVEDDPKTTDVYFVEGVDNEVRLVEVSGSLGNAGPGEVLPFRFEAQPKDGVPYPSVRVTPSSLDDLLSRLPVTGHSVLRTDNSIQRLRDGYDAMLLVTGWVTA